MDDLGRVSRLIVLRHGMRYQQQQIAFQPGPLATIAAQSSMRSCSVSAKGSKNTRVAVSKLTPCSFRFDAAFDAFHQQQMPVIAQI